MIKTAKTTAIALLMGLSASVGLFAQSNYKICGDNLIQNSAFDANPMWSTTVNNWTFTPAGDKWWGWRQDVSLIYGSALWIDRKSGAGAAPDNTNTAASNNMTLCPNGAKMVKFSYLSSNTYDFELQVKLAGVLVGTLTQPPGAAAGLAQSAFTPAPGITDYSILYNFWPAHYVTDNRVNNNIWHNFTILIPENKISAASGALEFVYTKKGVSRQVYLDNAEVYEAIPKPAPHPTAGTIDCSLGQTTFNLNTLLPAANPLYNYAWYADAAHTAPVANPAAVSAGVYYLFITSKCSGCVSDASVPVIISSQNCCGGNIVKNGTFDGATTTGTDHHLTNPTDIPNWTVGVTNPDKHHVLNSSAEINDNTNLHGRQNVYAHYTAGGSGGTLTQKLSALCKNEAYVLSFDFAVSRFAVPVSYHANVMLGGVNLFDLVTYGGATDKFGVTNLKFVNGTGVRVEVDGELAVANNWTQFTAKEIHRVAVTIPKGILTGITNTDLHFYLPQYYNWYIDNVELKTSEALEPVQPTSNPVAVDCPAGTFDLTAVQPPSAAFPDFAYRWYADAAKTTPLPNPKTVEPGTYYMATFSTCSKCESTAVPVTVTSNCPGISGKLFADYDGATNGISNTNQGFNGGGLYALLVNSNNSVVKSQRIAADGTFSFTATSGTYKLMLNDKDVAAGAAAPAAATLNPNYRHTGEGAGAGAAPAADGTPDGVINNIALNAGTVTAHFGINAAPIAVGNTREECLATLPATYPIPALTGHDDAPSSIWAAGVNQKIIIKKLSSSIEGEETPTSNGALKYDGAAVTAPFTITNYDPAKLLFEPAASGNAPRIVFEYVFVDAAGQESLAPAVVDYRLNGAPTIATQPLATQIICQNINAQALTVTAQGSEPFAYQWYKNTANSNTGGTAIAGATAATYAPATGTLGILYYYVTVTNPCGSVTSAVSAVTVQGSSTAFSPSVQVTQEICATNEGQIRITVPSGGTAPFTYKITAGTTIPAPVTTMERSHTFTNLAPGNYTISVTDVCQNTQTRGPYTLNPGNSAKPQIYDVFAYVSTECGFTDYYIVPGLGKYYPHTYYAYPNGDFAQTPVSRTVTADDLVTIPGTVSVTGGRKGFLMRLPQASPFVSGNGTAYAFKMTNACYTDVATVAAKNMATGGFVMKQIIQNCKNSLQVTLQHGWHHAVQVEITPDGGGASRTQTIASPELSTVFEDVAAGNYTVKVTDACGNTHTQRYHLAAPDMNVDIVSFCEANIDGLTGFYVNPKSGWAYPISVTVTSGPATYHSPILNRDITVTYPRTFAPDIAGNPIVRIRNVVPGAAYTLSITDGCSTKEVSYTAPNTNIADYQIAPLKWIGCPGTQDIVFDQTVSCGNKFYKTIYQKTGDKTWQLVAAGLKPDINTYRAAPGYTYRVFYVKDLALNELFTNANRLVSTPEYTLNQGFANSVWLAYQDISVPIISTKPTIGAYVLAECGGKIHVKLYASDNTASLTGYRIERTPGSGDFFPYQTSNRFSLPQYGKYEYSVKDVCGNVNTASLEIVRNTPPGFASDCHADGGITLTATRRPIFDATVDTNYKWTLPDNSVVEGDAINLGADRAAGVYKLTSEHTVLDDDNVTVVCGENLSTEFWVPEPSKQFPDLAATYNAAVSMPFNPAVPEAYKNTARIKWLKDNVEIAGAVGWTVNVTQSGIYTMQVKFPPLGCTFEYKQQITTNNYWMGGTAGKPNDWATADNWTAKRVPLTLPGQTAPFEDVVFATVENFGENAKADLYVDNAREVANFTNLSPVNLVIPTNASLTINGTVNITDAPEKIQVKASQTQPVGTLIVKKKQTKPLQATVEFYNKAYDCETCGFYTRKWQYFGIPVTSSAFPATGVETVNQWSEPANGNKWIAATGNLTAFTGYEITNSSKTEPANIYSFTGALNLTDATVPLTKTAGVNYSGMNLVSNSYTAAIPIKEEALQFATALTNKTVYLFNAGTRDQWRKLNGSTVNHATRAGQYKAVPIHLAGAAGLPGIIPSMHAFMLQADANNTLTIKYDQLVKNAAVDGMAWRSASGDVSPSGSPLSRGEGAGERPYIVMDVIGSRSADRVWLFENPSTTRGFDNGWDGHKMPETGIAQLYVSGDGGDKYQVATVPQMEGTELGFVADADQNYSVSFSVTPEVESRRLYLRDLRTRQFIPIRNGSEVIVRGQQGDTGNRFRVVSETAVADKLSTVEIFAKDRVITIVNHSDEQCAAYVYDVAGRLAARRPVKAKDTEYIPMPMQGVYVVKVIGQTVNEAKRVVTQ